MITGKEGLIGGVRVWRERNESHISLYSPVALNVVGSIEYDHVVLVQPP